MHKGPSSRADGRDARVSFWLGKTQVVVEFGFFAVLGAFLLLDPSGWGGLMVGSVVCHELAHLALLRHWRVPVRALRLQAFGVNIQRQTGSLGYRQEAAVYLAGPACNALLAGMGWALRGVCPQWALPLVAVNLVMGAVNLLPVPPLDGGQALGCGLRQGMGPRAAGWIGLAAAVAVLVPLTAGAMVLCWRQGNFTLLVLCAGLGWRVACGAGEA